MTGAGLSSVRLRVRGRPSVGLSARRSVPRSVRAPSPDRPTKCALAAESWAQPPGGFDTPQPRLRPASGRARAAPRELRKASGAGGRGTGSSCSAQGSSGSGSQTSNP